MADMEKDLEKDMEKDMEAQTSDTVEDTAPEAENPEEVSEEVQDDEQGDEAQTEEDDEKKKGKFFKKKDKKDPKDEKIEELNDRLVRNRAEFDNYRKRTDREKSQMFEMGASQMIEKILPVIDDLERGFAAMSEADKNTSFAQGIEMVYKKLMTTLTDQGVTVIEAVGKEFDPTYHNAVMQAPSEAYESGIVMQELQKGYMYKERIIRHSMVMVAE